MLGINNKNILDNRELYAEKIDHLYSSHKLGQVATLVNALILAVIQWDITGPLIITAWVTALVLITLLRLFLVRRYHQQDRKSDANITLWGNLFLVGVLLSGIVWGSAGIYLWPKESTVVQMLTAFTIGGMVAGASAVYALLESVFFAFSLPAMVPITVHCFMIHDSVHAGMGIMMLLFFLLMGATSRRNRKVFEASILLKFENKDLITYLSNAKDHADETNRKLIAENEHRKKIESELERHKAQLESEVEKRTSELLKSNQELKLEIKERRRVETALTESEERYRMLVENSIVGILLIYDHKIQFANSICSKICGYDMEEIINKPFLSFVHPDDHELAISNYAKRMKGEDAPDNYPIRMIDKEGATRWLEINATRLTYDNKPAILTLFKDITQQRQLELQVLQSEKMASIGQLAAGVAHEINNPIGFVNSNLHTLGEYQEHIRDMLALYKAFLPHMKNENFTHPEKDLICEKIGGIELFEKDIDLEFIMDDLPILIKESDEGLIRVKNIVSDLKNFAHPGNDTKQLTDINKNIESTLNMVWNELKYHVEVIKDLNSIPQIECYPQMLNQVFMNLFVNAAQAIEEKGEIKIQTSGKNSHIEIKISDTGMGIPRENLNKIFDPFFTTKDVGKGTGLGLNVSYNIIKKHDGTISVDSDVGKGTTFTITLPV